jgi:Holliday junction resolvasome RuvABC DNA-binding subunit
MIGKLKGLIDSYGEDFVILDVGGVGYQVHCSSRTLQALPAPGEAAVLAIETYVREDQIISSASGFACCRPCKASAPRSRLPCSAR